MIERIGVVGAGTMGAGIAQLACLGGFETHLHDPVPDALNDGAARLREALVAGVERDRWSANAAEAAAARLREARELERLAACDLVVEAAPEDLELKRALFAQLEEVCGDGAVLATNTSSLSVTAIAAGLRDPSRVCGMHFFNPPPLMRLVEVVAGDRTSAEVVRIASDVARAMDREPIRAADGIGFVANRVARPFTLEGLRLLGERIADHETIDRIARVGGGFRMGPFELMDLVGVDVNFEVAKSFWEQSFHEPRWQPHPIQARMVSAGRLGRKAGRGYYDYREGHHRVDDPRPAAADAVPAKYSPDPDLIEQPEFRALRLDVATLAERDPHGEALGFLALPTLSDSTVVEIVPGSATAPGALDAAEWHFASLGKHVERLLGDAPGLVLGRILCQLVNEAHFAAGEGVGRPDDIDTAMLLGFNHPRGPFDWTHALGPARVVAMLDALRAELGLERYRAAPLLRRVAAQGA